LRVFVQNLVRKIFDRIGLKQPIDNGARKLYAITVIVAGNDNNASSF
jgi:hypothetical protein